MVRLDIKDSKTELSSFTWTNIKLVHLNADIIILECQLENIPILNECLVKFWQKKKIIT